MPDVLEQITEAPADHFRRLKISGLEGDELAELSETMKLSRDQIVAACGETHQAQLLA